MPTAQAQMRSNTLDDAEKAERILSVVRWLRLPPQALQHSKMTTPQHGDESNSQRQQMAQQQQ